MPGYSFISTDVIFTNKKNVTTVMDIQQTSFNLLTHGRIGAELLSIQSPILTQVLTVIFCYYFHTWAVQLIRVVVHLEMSFVCWFRVMNILTCVFLIFRAEYIHGV